jgi:hypothetical protein
VHVAQHAGPRHLQLVRLIEHRHVDVLGHLRITEQVGGLALRCRQVAKARFELLLRRGEQVELLINRRDFLAVRRKVAL